VTSHRYESPVEQPPVDDWIATIHSLRDASLQNLRTAARRRFVQAARRYSEHLATIATERLGDAATVDPLDGSPDETPIVMTGHQPVVFHSGLTYKYEVAEAFCRQTKAIGIAMVIDTDEGDAGEFACPSVLGSEGTELTESFSARMSYLQTVNKSLAAAPAMHATSQLKPAAELRQVIDRVSSNLKACSCSTEAAQWDHVAAMYERLSGCSMLEANLIARRRAGIGAGLMEIRISEVCGFPEVVQFFGQILSRPVSFARGCNDALDQFRSEHKIRNHANPFPNLLVNDQETELPFWIVDLQRGTRRVPVVRRIDGVPRLQTTDGLSVELIPGHEAATVFSLLVGQTPLVPRGALITATMRLLFSDLFVHGTGGGRYDQFTSQFIREWWNEEPTPIAVASASRYLFDDERREVARSESIVSNLRDLQFNPQRHLGTGVFTAPLEAQLRQLLQQKEEAVSSLKQARTSGASAEDIGRVIQKLSDEIRHRVSDEFRPQVATFEALPESAINTIRNRTWPWFFFR
jgi:hypothetical protein